MAIAGLIVSIVAVLLELSGGPGARYELWHFRTGMAMVRWGFWAGGAGLALCQIPLLHAWRTGKKIPRLALAGWLLALPAVLAPLGLKRLAASVPVHNDYTTDPQDPPIFFTDIDGKAHPGPSSGAPGLEPAILETTEDEAYSRALQTAKDMGWEIVLADPKSLTVDAVATTRWFGFKDDVVVRVRPEKGMSRVDVRSASRVGKSDLGANARRIRAYLRKLGK